MLFGEIAYGPIHSRRLGTSLGMELMPLAHKLCSFNCVYCECGWNEPVSHPVLPTREEVKAALEKKLAAKLKSVLSIAAKVQLKAPGTIERSQGKSAHVIDKRSL